ncbi:Pga5 [Symbiodinium natans]|uniref:Pga5 protein n=1 Tax=Symbiodinium natans TaxID=878477 RepID=A0A812N4C1_9DINO|nr:Pga5 [Symbiodinium natans]
MPASNPPKSPTPGFLHSALISSSASFPFHGGPTLSLQLLTSPASATLELRNVNSLLYTADLDIGVAGRSARVVVDTGSADFWLKPNLLVEEVHGQKLVSASPRRQDVHGQLLVPEYLIRYGLGEVIAIPIVEERVCAGSLCLEQLELMLALKIQGVQEQGAFDGLAGLAFPPLQQAPTNQTLLQALQLRSGCAHFGFSLSLRGEGGQSLLSLGEVKDLVKAMEKAEGGSSIPVKVVSRDQDTEPGYWMVEVKMSVFNGKNQLLLAKGKGLLDSGSSFLAVPEGLVGYVVMALTYGHGGLPSLAVDESQRLLCRCDAGLNDLVFELPGEDGRTLRVNLTQDELLEPPTIIGDPLLRKVSVVFDVDGARVHVLPVGDKRGAALVAEGLAAGPPHELALLGLVCLLSTALAATCAWRCWWQGPGETGHYQYLAM